MLGKCTFLPKRFNSKLSLCHFGVSRCRFFGAKSARNDFPEPFVIAADGGIAHPSSLTSKEFLLSKPPGAYTTARTTCNGRRLFEWDTHVRRTAASVTAMLDSCTDPSTKCLMTYLREELGQPSRLRSRLDATVATGVHKYISTYGNENELKVTVLVTWAEFLAHTCAEIDFPGSVLAHISPLPPLPSPPVKVEVRGAPRANATAKDSSWVSERAPLEAAMRSDMNELLLARPDGEIFEGSQTNFYAVIDGAVHTAGEGVLEGTVRNVVLQVCEREGIPVMLSPPRVTTIDTWEGALISSTSRLLLPVHELYRPTATQTSTHADLCRTFSYDGDALACRLSDWVREQVETHSTEIAGP